ncbi:MAG TPA: glucose-6-phosphate isomerase [Chthoniobacterales bacterium]
MSWERFNRYFLRYDDLGFSIDISRMDFPDGFFESLKPKTDAAFANMVKLEAGEIANPDEQRMVGHYWLRDVDIAPDATLRQEILTTLNSIKAFAAEVHAAGKFKNVLVVGIGGSALGPQFVADALGKTNDPLKVWFFDNTDPDGIDRVLAALSDSLASTLVVVISKSGGTKETRNGMLEAEAFFASKNVPFAPNAVAVTGEGSELDKYAEKGGWLKRFPMWDWVGGRTSVMSAVGLLPAALQGIDITDFLAGAAAIDRKTRKAEVGSNASMLLAVAWYSAGKGKGAKDMVVLPYKDRLMLFSKYLQQLLMESLGKEFDLDGNVVNQGIAVYGNKGSTDQHAYVQQLRDGVNNFFATFIEVRKARSTEGIEVEPDVKTGDYLQGFLRGTRTALSEKGRESITLSIPEVTPFYVGLLIGLYERAVGFYATLVNINAYHQPGVEAGKKAAGKVLTLQLNAKKALKVAQGVEFTAPALADKLGADPEDTFHVLTHLAANDPEISLLPGTGPTTDRFFSEPE